VVDFGPARNQGQRERKAFGSRPPAEVREHVVDGLLDREQLVEVAVDLGAVQVGPHRSVQLAAAANEFGAERLKACPSMA